MKNAPHLKEPWNKQHLSDLIVLVGSDAWDTWGKGESIAWRLVVDGLKINPFIKNSQRVNPYDQSPVILGTDQLNEIANLRIADKKQTAIKFIQCGELTNAQKSALCVNIATHTKAQFVSLVTTELEFIENLSPNIKQLRSDTDARELTKSAVKYGTLLGKNPTPKELVNAFIGWFSKPLRVEVSTAIPYVYDGSKWEEKQDFQLKRDFAQFLDEIEYNYSADKLAKLVSLLYVRLPELPPTPKELNGFINGAINKTTGELLPLSEDLCLRKIELIELDLTGNTPYFDDWLAFVTADDEAKKQAILAGLYMVLTNRHEWMLFVECSGVGGGGKSVLGHIATHLNGNANTAFIDIDTFENDSNGRSMAVGKTLIYSADQRQFKGTAEELKKLTGGEMVEVKTLYKNKTNEKIDAIFMMTTNHPLMFIDKNGGIGRRRVIIPFDRVIPQSKKDADFNNKVKREIYGITKKLLVRFTKAEEARTILEDYRKNNESLGVKMRGSHVLEFAQYFTLTDTLIHGMKVGGATGTSTMQDYQEKLYKAYLAFCDYLNLKTKDILQLPDFKDAFQGAMNEKLGNPIDEQGRSQGVRFSQVKGLSRVNVKFSDVRILNEWLGKA
ncbi:DUF5906 domain-containing protein [Actinobacillus porcinus]|uniref:DUF5906 domain-containing protein n=1 Tax=Actinobacillus porcinus TaxID=51048 RepID=UPI002A90CCA4|nr:DUF5906 domain-containing protein [Actinobacillus porcinus]MDY6216352.1 DUF5906 domain-containing protein [Actinobacillus porcinus]